MEIVFIGGYFDKEYEAEFINNTKGAVENSANIFQRKLIAGFKRVADEFLVFSAPLIGAYPQRYRKMRFKVKKTSEINYVSFNNIWGFRNISRKRSLIKELDKKVDYSKNLCVVVYSAHSPFIEAARHIKKKSPSSKICLVVPDLPEYMMLTKKIPLYYKVFKYFDVKHIYRLCKFVDLYMVLTDHMLDVLPNGRTKESFVAEGIIDLPINVDIKPKCNNTKTILYCGKLDEAFGIMNLVNAFNLIRDNEVKLVICGKGEKADEISQLSDEKIVYKGQVSAHEATSYINEADILVNPRQNDMEYTKYSFPSKNIEYLLSGNAVVAYMLDGMSEKYKDFIYYPKDNSVQSLADALLCALNDSVESRIGKAEAAIEYMNDNLCADYICNKIINIIGK